MPSLAAEQNEPMPAWERLGLKHDPFPARLDTSFVRVSTQHREAVAELYYGVKKRAGLMLLTAEPGCGRREVLESLGDADMALAPRDAARIGGATCLGLAQIEALRTAPTVRRAASAQV